MKNMKKSQIFLLVSLMIGIIGSLGGVGADLFTVYSLNQPTNMTSVFSGMISNIKIILINKTHSDLVVGHYLAIIFIPLGIFGVWYISKMFKKQYYLLGKILFIIGAVVYAIGTTFHGTIGFIATALKHGNEKLNDLFIDFFEPLAILTMSSLIVLLTALAFFIVFKFTNYPSWVALISPLPLQISFSLLSGILPADLANLFLVSGLNLSMFIFFSICFVGHAVKWWETPDPSK